MRKSIYSLMKFYGLLCLINVLIHFGDAHAYIDPGTTSVAFSALGYIFSIAAMGIIFFIKPLKSILKSMYAKFSRKEKISEHKG